MKNILESIQDKEVIITTESTAITMYYGYTKYRDMFIKEKIMLIETLKQILFLLILDILKLLLFFLFLIIMNLKLGRLNVYLFWEEEI